MRSVAALRHEVSEHAEPARTLLGDLRIRIAREVFAARMAAVTGAMQDRSRYRQYEHEDRRVLRALRDTIGPLGAPVDTAVARLGAALTAWWNTADSAVASPSRMRPMGEGARRAQHIYEGVLSALFVVDRRIAEAVDLRARQLDQRDQLELRLITVMVVLAMIAVIAVAMLARREQQMVTELRRRSAREAALQELTVAINASISFTQVAQLVISDALKYTRACGAFVERLDRNGAEVIAGGGCSHPPLGTRVGLPGSISADDPAHPEVLRLEVGESIGSEMGPVLSKICVGCRHLVVPLCDDSTPLGTLVLIRDPVRGGFSRAEIGHARAVGNLAAHALHREIVLEREREARTTAEAALRSRDEVLSVVSHDLRNPLSSVIMTAHFLEEVVVPQRDWNAINDSLKLIRRAGDRMNRMIQDLLDASRIEAHKLVVVPKRVSVRAVLEEVRLQMRPLADERKQELSCETNADVSDVHADHDRLVQILSNLVGNAIKFTPEHGHIVVSASRGGDSIVRFSVKDTGPGIPPEHLPHLFDRFWQAKRADRRGLGLGLPIVKGLVDAHGGVIEIHTEEGRGTTFSFTIPSAHRGDGRTVFQSPPDRRSRVDRRRPQITRLDGTGSRAPLTGGVDNGASGDADDAEAPGTPPS